jgi:hypoxanthine phosphoribosyltransferase
MPRGASFWQFPRISIEFSAAGVMVVRQIMKTVSVQPRFTLRPAPARWQKEIAGVLISERQIARRVSELGAKLRQNYAGRDLVVVALLNGTVMFLADLIRHLDLPLRLDFMGVASYGSGTNSGKIVVTKELRLEVKRRDVLVVDDILDTGKTLAHVLKKLHALKPRQIRTCVLLDKPARRVAPIQPDYVGFQIPDHFVVGYGLDFAEQYRNLPFIGVMRQKG